MKIIALLFGSVKYVSYICIVSARARRVWNRKFRKSRLHPTSYSAERICKGTTKNRHMQINRVKVININLLINYANIFGRVK